MHCPNKVLFKSLFVFFSISLFFIQNIVFSNEAFAVCVLQREQDGSCGVSSTHYGCECVDGQGRSTCIQSDAKYDASCSTSYRTLDRIYYCDIGESVCSGSGGGNRQACYNSVDETPVWVRFISNENGQPVAWKPASDGLQGTPTNIDGDGNFTTYGYCNSSSIRTSHPSWPQGNLTFDTTKNVQDTNFAVTINNPVSYDRKKYWAPKYCGVDARQFCMDYDAGTLFSKTECNNTTLHCDLSCSGGTHCVDDASGCFGLEGRDAIPYQTYTFSRHGFLNSLLGFAKTRYWAPAAARFSDYWTMSYMSQDSCDSTRTSFDVTTPPTGYYCDTVNLYRIDGQNVVTDSADISNSSLVVTRTSNGGCKVEFNPHNMGNLVYVNFSKVAPPYSKILSPGVSNRPTVASVTNTIPDAKVCLGDNLNFSLQADHSQNVYGAYLYYKLASASSWVTPAIFSAENINRTSFVSPALINFTGTANKFAKNSDYFFALNTNSNPNFLNKFTQCTGSPLQNWAGNTLWSYCGNGNFADDPWNETYSNSPWRKIHVVADPSVSTFTLTNSSPIAPSNFSNKITIAYSTSNLDSLGIEIYRKLTTDTTYTLIDSFNSNNTYSSYLRFRTAGSGNSGGAAPPQFSYNCTTTSSVTTCTVVYTDTSAICTGASYTYQARLVTGYQNIDTTYRVCPYTPLTKDLALTCVGSTNSPPVLSLTLRASPFGCANCIVVDNPTSSNTTNIVSPLSGINVRYDMSDNENNILSLYSTSQSFGSIYLLAFPPSIISAFPGQLPITNITPPITRTFNWRPDFTFNTDQTVLGGIGWVVNGTNITIDKTNTFLVSIWAQLFETATPTKATTVTKNVNVYMEEPTRPLVISPVADIGGVVVSNDYRSYCDSAVFDTLSKVGSSTNKTPEMSLFYSNFYPSSQLKNSSLSHTSDLSLDLTALPNSYNYSVNLSMPNSGSLDRYEIKCVKITNVLSPLTVVYQGSLSTNFTFPFSVDRNGSYVMHIVVGKVAPSAWVQGVGGSISALTYSGTLENFSTTSYLLNTGSQVKPGLFFSKLNINGSSFNADSNLVPSNAGAYLYIPNGSFKEVTEFTTRSYLSKTNFMENLYSNFVSKDCIKANTITHNGVISDVSTCFTKEPFSIDKVITLLPGVSNIYFPGDLTITENITASEPFPIIVVKGDLTISSNVTLLSGIYLVGGNVVFSGNPTKTDTQLVINGSILSRYDIIVQRDGLLNSVNPPSNNTEPIVKVNYSPSLLLNTPTNLSLLRESLVTINLNE